MTSSQLNGSISDNFTWPLSLTSGHILQTRVVWVWDAGMVICLGWGADLPMA